MNRVTPPPEPFSLPRPVVTASDAPAALFGSFTAHCFFAPRCPHIEQGLNPDVVHAAMERHYRAAHTAAIDSIVGRMK